MAAAWLAATGGVPVAAVHAALLGLDRYAEFYPEPGRVAVSEFCPRACDQPAG
jgi:hypothetical protein